MSYTRKISYYDQFKCTADACPFNCCQEWRITVDEDTLDKWQGIELKAPKLRLCDCVKEDEQGPMLAMKQDKQCPLLNEKKLCRLVCELGEDYLSETCTTFPRQINEFEAGKEYSLDAGCPVVIDLMREQTTSFIQEGSLVVTPLYLVREMILKLIEEETYSLPERLMMIFYGLLDLLGAEDLTEEQIKACQTPSYLQPIAEAIRQMPFNEADSLFERNELFLDVAENYRKQKFYEVYLNEVAEVAETLGEDYYDEELTEKHQIFEEELLQYEKLLKNYLLAEAFGNGLNDEMELEDVMVAFEWLVMEYVTMKQALFLKWLLEEKLTYEMVRDYMMMIARVTGYVHSDIREYLENSFESVIWEWGYLALAVGNQKI